MAHRQSRFFLWRRWSLLLAAFGHFVSHSAGARFGNRLLSPESAPVLGLTDMSYHRFSLVADHWQHLSLIGLTALVAAVGVHLCRRFSQSGQRVATVCGIAIIALFSCLTWHQAGVYENMETWCRDTLAKNPTAWVAHDNLGVVLQDRHDLPHALQEFQLALKARPDILDLRMNAGLVLAQLHRLRDAAEQYAAAVRCAPGSIAARYDLATTHWMLGDVAIATAEYEEILTIAPDHGPRKTSLAVSTTLKNRQPESLAHFRIAAARGRITPTFDSISRHRS